MQKDLNESRYEREQEMQRQNFSAGKRDDAERGREREPLFHCGGREYSFVGSRREARLVLEIQKTPFGLQEAPLTNRHHIRRVIASR